MTRRAKLALAGLGIVLLLPVVLSAAAIDVANTAPGRHLIERLAGELSGGQVALSGLSGRFPDALHLDRLDLKDAGGLWATAENVDLVWSPLRLVTGEARIDRLAAARIELMRQPQSSAQSESSAPRLPLRVDLQSLQVARLDVDAPLAGSPVALSLQGSARVQSPTQGHVALTAERIGGEGHYAVEASLDGGRLAATVEAHEPAQGLLADLAGLPEIGALSITAKIDGPRSAEEADVKISAGPLTASAQGTVDLVGRTGDVTIAANAPAMTPAPDIAWQSVAVQAHVQGAFEKPSAQGHVDIENVKAGEASLQSIGADLRGSDGAVELTAALAGLRLPDPVGDLFQSAPVALHAEARLDAPDRPFSFTLAHPLLKASGHGSAGATKNAAIAIEVPALAPLAAVLGLDLQGHAALTAGIAEAGEAMKLTLGGTVAITGGVRPVPALLGDAATLDVAATLTGKNLALDHAAVEGKTLHATAEGGLADGTLALGWTVALSNLAVLEPTLAGTASAKGRLDGQLDDLALDASAIGAVTVRGFKTGTVELKVAGKGLPNAPEGTIDAQGTLAGAPLRLAASMKRRTAGGFDLSVAGLHWKSLDTKGELSLAPGAVLPEGKMTLSFARVADLAPFVDAAVSGSIDGALDMTQSQGRPQARLTLTGKQLAFPGGVVDRMQLDGTIDDPVARPRLTLRLTTSGIDANGVTGAAALTASGPLQTPALALSSDLQRQGVAGHLDAAATVDGGRPAVTITKIQLSGQGETVRLLGPSRIDFATGLAIDRLRLGVDKAVLDIAGQIMPRLNATASVRDLTVDVVKPFVPGLAARGTISADAKLSGTPSAPTGSIDIKGRDLQWLGAAGGAIAPASLDATGELAGSTMRVDAKLGSGRGVALSVAGQVPLNAAGALDLHTQGTLDLTVFDPVLTAGGRRVLGQMTLDTRVAGSFAAPRITGTAQLTNGEVQDFAVGLRLAGVTARLDADGGTVRLLSLDAKAGPGTISASGSVALTEDGMPVAVTITARDARPLASDLLTTTLDADLSLRGKATGRLDLGGQVRLHRADITIPDSFPASVAVLNVQTRGAKPPPPAPPGPTVGLDLTIDAPGQVFLRGHGLDAEMGGRFQLGGTIATPVASGGFDMRRGTYSIAGQTLTFTSGRVSFDGNSLTRRLDPSLNFVAQTSTAAVTAILTVSGYADAPKIEISSVPTLPQDEVLAQLLFGQSVKQLTPLQLASIAQAIASLSGVGGGLDPLGAVRKGLGLDRLTAGSSGSGGASVQAGKYVANGVYVGAQGTSSGGTSAQVQIDLTKHLKLSTVIGTGAAPPSTTITPDNDPGSSIGLTYQLEY